MLRKNTNSLLYVIKLEIFAKNFVSDYCNCCILSEYSDFTDVLTHVLSKLKSYLSVSK